MFSEIFEITTISIDEAATVRASGFTVTVSKKPCSPRAQFAFPDIPEIRDILERYARREILQIPARVLMIARADLYREARSARAGGQYDS